MRNHWQRYTGEDEAGQNCDRKDVLLDLVVARGICESENNVLDLVIHASTCLEGIGGRVNGQIVEVGLE